MRIIAGHARGRRLLTPEDDSVRPTTDRIRESLFSILGDIEGVSVLDGFAGSGALGCEALSRGAKRCDFFDLSSKSVQLVSENLKRIDATDTARVSRCAFVSGLSSLTYDPDLVFIDPPYHTPLAQEAVDALAASPRITPGALVVVEQDIDDAPVEHPSFELDDERVYGRTRLRFLRRAADVDASGA
jgi:16S rRNA (guanine966-N2)-methyltransferase